ncbi:RNA polymerase sigma factor [Massilia sp. TSP1-1-2]|uniref:RNA polymerase sigma factor n=1 Tax=unclassified Massilia TaxID=2609279 RepID=UPI003CFADE57
MLPREAQPDQLVALLRRVGGGDARAFGQLHALSSRRLLRFAGRIVQSRDIAEEVVQESFLAIWRDARRFDCARAAPMTWMSTIVRNKAIDCVRANARREHLTDHDSHDAASASIDLAGGPCEAAEQAERERQLAAGIATLGMLSRQAIELAFFHDMTHHEVAMEMTIPLGTAKTWIRRGCRQIRRHLEQSSHAMASACGARAA